MKGNYIQSQVTETKQKQSNPSELKKIKYKYKENNLKEVHVRKSKLK